MALVVVVEGKPYHPPAFDIAAAYERYHQLWITEARRNAVAPLSISQQVARSRPGKQSAVTKVAPPAPVAEKPPQEQLTSEKEKAMVDQRNQEQMVTEQQTEMMTEVQTQETVAVEPTPTESSVIEEMTTVPTQETTQNTNQMMRSTKKQSSLQQQSLAPTARPATNMKTAFDNFFTRWNSERVRNSIPPVATPIPPLSSFYTMKTKLTKQPLANKPVDPSAQGPANDAKTIVDTLTQVGLRQAWSFLLSMFIFLYLCSLFTSHKHFIILDTFWPVKSNAFVHRLGFFNDIDNNEQQLYITMKSNLRLNMIDVIMFKLTFDTLVASTRHFL